MSLQIYSFDVYDTCFIRNFAYPTDLFFVLAEKILVTRDVQDFSKEEIIELARLRIKAEQDTRDASDKEDVTFADIYQKLNLAGWGISKSVMMELELKLEFSSIRPILSTKQKIETLRKQGYRIIFISDMYLPQQTIKQMLMNHELAYPNDPVYVSGDIGLTKHSGNLFPYVLKKENILSQELWHHGDNPYSDVIIPNKSGIKTTFFQQSQLNRYEGEILSQGLESSWIYSQFAGVSRVTRLMSNPGRDSSEITNIAANVVAPLLTCFVVWLIQDAQERGLERLYFVSRDGQILLKIALELAKYMPAPECRYLYGSRQAWLLPSIFSCDRKNIEWLTLNSKTPRNLLNKLNIEVDSISHVLSRYGFEDWQLEQHLDAHNLERFWQVIEDREVTDLILSEAAALRQTVLAYFDQEGLCSSSKWAIVDVGWALRGQRAIKQILQSVNCGDDIQGYYLAVSENRKFMSETGTYHAFLSSPESYDFYSPNRYLLNNVMLVEHLFVMADHATVTGYKEEYGKIMPILKENSVQDAMLQLVPKFHQTILHYVDEISKTELLQTYNNAILKQTFLTLAKEFISNPTSKEAEIASQIQTVVDQTHNELLYNRLARSLGVNDLFYIIRYFTMRLFKLNKGNNFNPKYNWLEGSLVMSSVWIRSLFFPVRAAMHFKQNNGRLQIYKWWAKIIAKEN